MYIEPGKGKLKLSNRSSLRKLMRASRRGKIPDERLVVIEGAEQKAATRADVYLHSMARAMAALRDSLKRRAAITGAK